MAICDSFTDYAVFSTKNEIWFLCKKIVGNHSANLIKCNFIMILQFMISILFQAFRIFFFKLVNKYFCWKKFQTIYLQLLNQKYVFNMSRKI